MALEAPHVSTGPFARALEPAFSQLPEPLRAFHGVAKFQRFTGMAELEVSTSPIARTVLWLAGFPRQSGTVPLVVEVEVTNHVETWRRDFGGKATVSTLQFREGLVLETFEPVTCALDLRCDEDRIVVGIGRAWIFRVIPLPRALTPISTSVEYADEEGRFCFDIGVHLTAVGRLIRYRGHLAPVDDWKRSRVSMD